MITWRAALLLAAGALSMPLWPWPWIGLAVVLTAVAALAALDFRAAAALRHVTLTRSGQRAVRLGDSAVVQLHIHNQGVRTLRAEIRDDWVPSAGAQRGVHRLEVEPGETAVVENRLRPTRRGDRPAVRVTVRSHGPLRLAFRQLAGRPVTPEWTLRTLPRFESRRFLAEKVSRLRILDGSTVTRGRGQGTEFDALREYVVGDDVRSIDWRASARRSDVLVRTWRPERDRRVLCVIDTGRTSAARVDRTAAPGGRRSWLAGASGLSEPSGGVSPFGASPSGVSPFGASPSGVSPFGVSPAGEGHAGAAPSGAAPSGAASFGADPFAVTPPADARVPQHGEPRLDAAIDAALLLAVLAARAGDRVDLLAVDTAVRAAVSGAGREALLPRLVDAVAPLQPALVETDFELVVGEILRRERKRALVVLFTTLEPGPLGEGLLPVLPRLAARHKVILASVHDPALAALTARPPDTPEQAYAAAAAHQAYAERNRVRAALTRHGVDVVDAPLDEFASRVSDAYLTLKAAGRL
ncbi:uncharacterized protein (DUF58 family) [Catenuloplanes nepalensis]|uniref:Uncharacterized protein (DUF58 family) n=1 Tax=Catenuloplanes nepalensis TaxID=587533 RepID=A0ABT9N8I0_9ACTN|nr:DUF58 domain-containing protein [Catenuloplanes nepalensis]MDP9799536.1 uncharacterized protein (DUF58 family) [Catenuloplanes nepalensis]